MLRVMSPQSAKYETVLRTISSKLASLEITTSSSQESAALAGASFGTLVAAFARRILPPQQAMLVDVSVVVGAADICLCFTTLDISVSVCHDSVMLVIVDSMLAKV